MWHSVTPAPVRQQASNADSHNPNASVDSHRAIRQKEDTPTVHKRVGTGPGQEWATGENRITLPAPSVKTAASPHLRLGRGFFC